MTASDGAPFIVHYRARGGYLLSRLLWYMLIPAMILGFLTLAQDAIATAADISLMRGVIAAIAVILLALLIDYALLMRAVLSGAPALVIDRDGIRGHRAGWTHRFGWAEVDGTLRQMGILNIFRAPQHALHRAHSRFVMPGGRHDLRRRIAVPLRWVDRSESEILAALSRYRRD